MQLSIWDNLSAYAILICDTHVSSSPQEFILVCFGDVVNGEIGSVDRVVFGSHLKEV